jgi:hypothetical protein
MYWTIKSVNREEHTVEALKFDKYLSKVKVPIIFPLPGKDSKVLIDETTNTVTCIVTLSSLDATDTETTQQVLLEDGDVGYSLPGLGFMAIRKGLKAVLGAGSTGLFVDGALKQISAYTNRFLIAGNGFAFDISAPDSALGLPELRVTMGDIFSLVVKPSNKQFILDIFGIVSVAATSDKFTVKAINPYTGTSRFIVNETFKEDSMFDSPSDVVKKFSAIYKMVMNINTINVTGTEATASFGKIGLKASAGMVITAASLVLKGINDINLIGNNVFITLGDKAKAGALQINNGIDSHLRMDKKVFGIYGMKSINLNGNNDNLVSYNEFKKFAQEVNKGFNSIMTYGVNPYGLPSVAANLVEPYSKMMLMVEGDIIKNRVVKVGYPTGNKKGAE